MQKITVTERIRIQNDGHATHQYIYPGESVEIVQLGEDRFVLVREHDGALSYHMNTGEVDYYTETCDVEE